MDFDTPRAGLVAMALALAAAACAAYCPCGARVESAAQTTGPAPAVAPPPTPVSRQPAAGLPVPPGPADLPRPAGPPGNLKVLDWAGFRSAVSYTFDDGQPSQIEHYADLQATGVRLTFFLNSASASWQTDFVATFSQAARDGHEIGNHTAHHCHADADGTLYTGTANHRAACPGASAAVEFDDCAAFIAAKLGVPQVWSAAWPFGDAGFQAAAAERFFLSRGVVPGNVAPNDETDPLNLPMWGPAEGDTADKLDAVVDQAHDGGRWVILLLHSLAPTTSAWYATVDIGAVTGSIAHAKARGDVWIDSMVNVGAYWRGQKLLAAATPVVTGTTQTWAWTLPAHFPPGKQLRVRVDGGTLSQAGQPLHWDAHGYYEIALDAGALTLSP